MSAAERRKAVLAALCARRHDTYENLAQEFSVSTRTIQRDVEELMCSYPLKTVRGRCGGGGGLLSDPENAYPQRDRVAAEAVCTA